MKTFCIAKMMCALDRDQGRAARREALKKLTWPEWGLVVARSKAVGRFLEQDAAGGGSVEV